MTSRSQRAGGELKKKRKRTLNLKTKKLHQKKKKKKKKGALITPSIYYSQEMCLLVEHRWLVILYSGTIYFPFLCFQVPNHLP